MLFPRLVLIPVFFALVSCASAPRLVGLEDWRDDEFESSTRQFREKWISPYTLKSDGSRTQTVNPKHTLRGSDLLELSCVDDRGDTISHISVSGYYYDDSDQETRQDLASEAMSAILPLGVVSDFHKLEFTCHVTGNSEIVRLCKSLSGNDCAHHIGNTSWGQLYRRFPVSLIRARLRPRPDPVLYPLDTVRITRHTAADNDDEPFGLVDNFLVEVGEDGLIPLPIPKVSPADQGPDFDFRRQRAWISSAAAEMFAIDAVSKAVCDSERVPLSTLELCLNWADEGDLGVSTNNRTPSMKARVRECEALGIDRMFRPLEQDLINSWSLTVENNDATLVIEDGRQFSLRVGDGAALLPAVQQAYRQITGRELLESSALGHRVAYLTVQPRVGTCSQHASPFFIRVDRTTRDLLAPIRLLRGDTIHVSRWRPHSVK